MKSDIAEVEAPAKSVQDEGSTGRISEAQGAGPNRIRGGHRNRGPGRSWVTPWLTMSNSSTSPYHCDWFEPNAV